MNPPVSTKLPPVGYLDLESSTKDVRKTLREYIQKAAGVIPQKYLYTSRTGAQLWSELCNGPSLFGEVYRAFEMVGTDAPLPSHLSQILQELWVTNGAVAPKVGIVALGCGIGLRECRLAKWLTQAPLNCQQVEVLLVDVSCELLRESLIYFRKNTPAKIHTSFAVLDMDHQTEMLGQLRKTLFDGMPVLFVVFGYTLSNIDPGQTLGTMQAIMEEGDVLLVEIASAPPDSVVSSKEQQIDPTYRVEKDEWRSFVLDPVSSLGITPKPEQLEMILSAEKDQVSVRTYRYRFEKEGKDLGISSNASLDLLSVKSVTKKYAEQQLGNFFPGVRVVSQEYQGIDATVTMLYALGSKSPFQTNNGVAKSRKKTEILLRFKVLPRDIVISAGGQVVTLPLAEKIFLLAAAKALKTVERDNLRHIHVAAECAKLFQVWSKKPDLDPDGKLNKKARNYTAAVAARKAEGVPQDLQAIQGTLSAMESTNAGAKEMLRWVGLRDRGRFRKVLSLDSSSVVIE